MPFHLFKLHPIIKIASSYVVGKGNSERSNQLSKTKKSINETKNVKGKVALITGGAKGFGSQIAREFLKAGAAGITLVDINSVAGVKFAKGLEHEYGQEKVLFVSCNIGKAINFNIAYKRTIKQFNQLDVVVNNVGMLVDTKWENNITTNIGGCIIGSMLGIQYMSKATIGHGGTIINIASTCGLVSASDLPIYTMTQSAIVGLSRALGNRYQLEKTGVKVITLCVDPVEGSTLGTVSELLEDCESLRDDDGHVSKAVMEVMVRGETGSVWVTQIGAPPFEIDLPDDIEDFKITKQNV